MSDFINFRRQWFTESCFPLALRQPISNWFRLEITVGIRLTLWSACILRWIPPRVPLVGFKIPASLQAVHSECRKGLMSCVGFFPPESEGKQCRSAVSQGHSVRDVFTTLEQKGLHHKSRKKRELRSQMYAARRRSNINQSINLG